MVTEVPVNRAELVLEAIDGLVANRTLVLNAANKEMSVASATVITRDKLHKQSEIDPGKLQKIMARKIEPNPDDLDKLV